MKIAYNLLWVSPAFHAEGQALPASIRENILRTAATNKDADIMLWVDAARLTQGQLQECTSLAREANHSNIRLRNLRDLPEYTALADARGRPFFDIPNDTPRTDKHGIFWRQVDVARILAIRQSAREDYDQVFYADADIANLSVGSAQVQQVMQRHGVLLCAGWVKGSPVENQLFAVARRQAPLLEPLLEDTVADALRAEINGFNAMRHWAKATVIPALGLQVEDIPSLCFTPRAAIRPLALARRPSPGPGSADSTPQGGRTYR